MAGKRVQFVKTLLQRALAEFLDDRCPQLAASIAYHVLFSIFPLAIVLAAIFGIVVSSTGLQVDVADAIVENIPLSESGSRRLHSLLLSTTRGLSALGLVAIVGLLWSASGMMASVRTAVNAAWDVEEPRPFLRGKLVDVGLVFATALLALVSLGLTIAVRTVGGNAEAGVDVGGGWTSWFFGIVVPLALSFGVVVFLYRLLPAVDVRLREIWPGALLAACVFVLAENLFALYVENFASYNAVYGSLGAVVAFMFFVYLSAAIFLLGAEVASEWPRVRRAVEHDEIEPGAPFSKQVRDALKGLWVRQRQDEAGTGTRDGPPRVR